MERGEKILMKIYSKKGKTVIIKMSIDEAHKIAQVVYLGLNNYGNLKLKVVPKQFLDGLDLAIEYSIKTISNVRLI